MASIIDTIRTIFGCKHSALKLIGISVILAYPLFQVVSKFEGWTAMWTIVTYVAIVFYAGYILLTSSNLINEKEILLPGFLNPFKIFFVGLGGVLAIGPMIALMGYVGYCLYMIFMQKEMPMPTLITGIAVAELLMLGAMTVQMTLYTSTFNPLQSYNLIKILKAFPEFTIKSIAMFLGLGLFATIVFWPLGFLAQMMFGQDLVFFFVMVIFATVLLMLATQYYSQLFMESLVLSRKLEYEDDAGSITDKQFLVDEDHD